MKKIALCSSRQQPAGERRAALQREPRCSARSRRAAPWVRPLPARQSRAPAVPRTEADASPARRLVTPANGAPAPCRQQGEVQGPRARESLISLHFWLYFTAETSGESQPFTPALPSKHLMTNKKILSQDVSEFNYCFLFLFSLITN